MELEVRAVATAREVRQSVDAYQAEQEKRRREAEKAIYDLGQERQSVLIQQAEEDRVRQIRIQDEERNHRLNLQTQTAIVENSKKNFVNMVNDILGQRATVENFDPRTAKETLEKKIESERDKSFLAGKAEVQKEFEYKEKLNEAALATKISLLEEKESNTRKKNEELTTENRRLQDQLAQMMSKMAEMPAGAFTAAAGLVNKGNEALSSAAQAGTARTTNR